MGRSASIRCSRRARCWDTATTARRSPAFTSAGPGPTRAASYVAGWVGNVAVALAAVGYMAVFFHGLAVPLTGLIGAIALTWVLAGANLIGPRLTAGFSGMTLVIGLIPIAAAIALGFAHFDPALFAASW